VREKLSSFTKGLIKDLREISSAKDEEIAKSALAALIPEDVEQSITSESSSKAPVYMQTSPLNPSQRGSVDRALHHRLAVIQGPPGTGKSTVVQSTLLSVGANGGSALFASRNHRAVEAVVEPLKKISGDTWLIADLRRRAYEGNWINLLLENMNSSAQEGEKRLAELRSKLACLEKEAYALKAKIEQIFLLRDRLAEVNHKLNQKRATGSLECEQFAKTVELFRGPENVLRLFQDRELSFLHPRRWFAILALRKVLADVRRHVARGEAVNCQALKEIALWRELHQKCKLLETGLKDQLDINEASSSLFELVEKQLETVTEAAPGLAGAWADRVRDKGNLLVSLRAELRNNTPAGRKRLDDLGRKHFGELLPGLPLWATTNLSIHHNVPLVAGTFDLAIIDEAAQCDPASVIPILFRTKRAMFVGDPQQLPPINLLASWKEEEFRRKHGLGGSAFTRFAYSRRSAYGMAQDALLIAGGDPMLLREHYRCHPEIAQFFNQEFYDGNLLIRTTAASRGKFPGGLRWTHVPGGSESLKRSRWHPLQVEAIVAELCKLAERKFDGTVGVVTPFREHAKRIRDAAHQAIGARQAEKWDFIADTADGFQGGERDLVLFGLVGGGNGPNPTPPFYLRERNRFNVAVSRARLLLHVFGDLDWARKCEVPVLNNLALACQRNEVDPSREIRHDLIGPVWEPLFSEELHKAGIEFRQQYPAIAGHLDFAFFPKDGRKIDVEVDGETYHRDRDGNLRKEDIERDLLLRADGWTVQRFWVYQLREDMEACINKTQRILLNP